MTEVSPPRRYANGRKKRASRAVDRLNEANAADTARTMSTALNGPHRRGNSDPLCECPIGRFVLRFSLARELAEAALIYADVTGKWRAAITAPTPDRISGSGCEPDEALIRKWEDNLRDWRRAMTEEGGKAARIQLDAMILDLVDFSPRWDFGNCFMGLVALAKCMGKL